MDSSLPCSSIHGILQARILEWVAISFSSRSAWPRDWTWVYCTAGRLFTIWTTREAHHTDIRQLIEICWIFYKLTANKLFQILLLQKEWASHSIYVRKPKNKVHLCHTMWSIPDYSPSILKIKGFSSLNIKTMLIIQFDFTFVEYLLCVRQIFTLSKGSDPKWPHLRHST